MQVKQEKVLDTGKRVQGFLDTQGSALGTTVPAQLRAQLDAAVTKLSGAQVDQETLGQAAKAEIARQNAIRKEVSVDFLVPIGRIVRRAFPKSPDFQALVVPAGLTRKSDFLGKVTAATAAAATHAQDLINHGMPADFITQMQAAVGQLSASVDTRGKQVSLHEGTATAIKEATKAIRDAVHIMDGNMRRALKKNQPLLTTWIAAKRVQATVVTPLAGGDLNATPNPVPAPTPVVSAPVVSAPAATATAKPAA